MRSIPSGNDLVSQQYAVPLRGDAMNLSVDSGITFPSRRPFEKLVALRQCIDRICINEPTGKIELALWVIPSSGIQAIVVTPKYLDIGL